MAFWALAKKNFCGAFQSKKFSFFLLEFPENVMSKFFHNFVFIRIPKLKKFQKNSKKYAKK